MAYCRLCNTSVSDGIHLSEGSMVHESCLDSLQNKAIKIEDEIRVLESKLSRLERELRRRRGIGFKILSIFSKSNVELADIEQAIPVVRDSIAYSNSELTAINTRLASLYDYFMAYPPDWDERKKEVISRDGKNCKKCGSLRHLHLHHITLLSRGGSNKISNLILLCENCHSKEHGGRDFNGEFNNLETAFSKRVSNIRYAIEKGKHIEFSYKKPSEKGYKKRTIKPLALVNLAHRRDNGSTLCVLGFCELRKANRNFALKRMKGLKVI